MQIISKKEELITKKLSQVIKKLIKEKTGYSATKFAYSYDIEKSTVLRIQRGDVYCKLITIWKIANALGIKCSELISYIENELCEEFTLIDE